MRTWLMLIPLCLVGAALLAAQDDGTAGGPEFTTDFDLEDCPLSPNGRNPYFSLQPGTTLRLEGLDEGDLVEVEIKVLDQIEPIQVEVGGELLNVNTRVVREREWVNGELVEVSRNFFARCTKTDNIFYFGENVNIYKNGQVVSLEGAWRAGVNGALPGLIMPSTFLLGSRYFQEMAPDVAMDRARHAAMGLTVDTPAGTFQDCVKVIETTPLEPGSQSVKIYAPGVGLIFDSGVELVEFIPGG